LATLEEIAKKTGLSVSTVSRVVNNQYGVNKTTRAKVTKALETYKYIPHMMARGLKTGRTYTVGVIIPDVRETFFANVLCGIDEILSEAQYNMLLCISGEDPYREAIYLSYFSQNRVDGVIIAPVSPNDTQIYADFVISQNIVFIDNLPQINPINAVITDNAMASEIAVSYLYGLGHRKIATIAGKQTETTGISRLSGYKSALNRFGESVDERMIHVGDFKEKSGYTCMKQLLQDVPDLTAVYVASSQMTYGAIKAIMDAGKRIPADISVLGFDVHDPTSLITPGITTIIQQEINMGKIASRMLLALMEHTEEPVYQKIMLPSELLVRQSCSHI